MEITKRTLTDLLYRQHFEKVLLLIRTIANPDERDSYFTTWRHKDWYQGSSWASGITTTPPNGRNQESSSEAIAAYEAVALYGQVMTDVWRAVGSTEKTSSAQTVLKAGQVLLASEIRSTQMYWHVFPAQGGIKIYPSSYKQHVVGILWQTMVQFQTWFGGAPYLAFGIQMLPFTPISEARDSPAWLKSMYSAFEESCLTDAKCYETGWRVTQLAMQGAVGQQSSALKSLQGLDEGVFSDPGGNGHSRSNTIWYIATRPEIGTLPAPNPQNFPRPSGPTPILKPPVSDPVSSGFQDKINFCGVPRTCTNYFLDVIADEYSCRQRITRLIEQGMDSVAACHQVASIQFPKQCGQCNPSTSSEPTSGSTENKCPPCSHDVCKSDLNRCPQYEQTFLCTKGNSRGGCSPSPWELNFQVCQACCEITDCPKEDTKVTRPVPAPTVQFSPVLARPISRPIARPAQVTQSPIRQLAPVRPVLIPAPLAFPRPSPFRPVRPTPVKAPFDRSPRPFPSKKGGKKSNSVERERGSAVDSSSCPPCSESQCRSVLNLCPTLDAPYLCLAGRSAGGCSSTAWSLSSVDCLKCCSVSPSCGNLEN